MSLDGGGKSAKAGKELCHGGDDEKAVEEMGHVGPFAEEVISPKVTNNPPRRAGSNHPRVCVAFSFQYHVPYSNTYIYRIIIACQFNLEVHQNAFTYAQTIKPPDLIHISSIRIKVYPT